MTSEKEGAVSHGSRFRDTQAALCSTAATQAPAEMPGAREIRVEGDLAYVPLTRGRTAIIDAADVPLVDGVLWTCRATRHNFYAVRLVQDGSKRKLICMHRLIMNAPPSMLVDHINADSLDNRRSNLRLATNTENTRNQRRNIRNTSGLKGVSWQNSNRKWRAQIKVNGQRKYLGSFARPEDAHRAYCEAAALYHGDYARAE